MKAPDINDFDAVCEYVREVGTTLLWRIAVVPRQAAQRTESGLEMPEETQQADFYNTKVGRVVHVPPLAYTAHTKAHIDLSAEPNKPQEGDWVLFPPNSPNRVELVGPSPSEGIHYFLLNDTDILQVIKHPDCIRSYL